MKCPTQYFTYEHPWELVVDSYLMRYPVHDRLPVLLRTEVISDTTHEETHIRSIERICVVDIEAPGWLKKTLGHHDFTFLQTTTLDPVRRSMKISNINVSFKGKVSLGDDCEYRAHDTNPNWTSFEQEAFLELPSFPLSSVCEKYMARSYQKNTSEGRNIDLTFIRDAVDAGWHQKNPAPPSAEN